MKLTTTLVAALGLLTSVTVALPTSGNEPVAESTGIKARSADPLGIQGSIMNGIAGWKPEHNNVKHRRSAEPLGIQGTIMNGISSWKPVGGDPREDPNYRDDKQRRSAEPLGIQGTIMNGISSWKPVGGDPREDPNYRDDKQRRAIDTTTEVASKDADLFTITLCNKINRGGTCVEAPMMKNMCQSFPLLVTTRSLYMSGTTQCWVFNNDECHMNGDINDLWIWRWKDTDDLQAAGMTFTPRGWLCDDFA